MEIPLNLNLPTKILELSIPELEQDRSSFDFTGTGSDEDVNFNDKTYGEFASQAEFFNGKKLSISWRLLDDNKLISISPLELDANRTPQRGRSLQIRLPFIAVKNCIGISETENSELVFDIVTQSGHICTFTLPQSWLLIEDEPVQQRTDSFSVDDSFSSALNKRTVVNYKYKLNSVPKLAKSVNHNKFLVFLADGTFLEYKRNVSSKGFASPSTLHDSFSYTLSGGWTRFFHLGTSYVPDHPKLSYNAVVQAELFDDNYVVTYSVDKSIRLWDLSASRCIQKIPSLKNDDLLRLRVGSFISLKEKTLAVLNDTVLSFYELQYAAEQIQLVELVDKRTTVTDTDMIQWFVSSVILLDPSKYEVLVVYSLDAAFKVYLYRSGNWYCAGTFDHGDFDEVSTDFTECEIKQRVAKYPNVIVQAAFMNCIELAGDVSTRCAVAKQQGNADVDDISELLNLMEPKNEINLKWAKFDTICRNLEATGSRVLGVATAMFTLSGGFFWVLKSSGVSILGLNIDDIVHNNDTDSPMLLGDSSNNIAIKTAKVLFDNVSSTKMQQIDDILLSPKVITTKLSMICNILRTCLDELTVNEVTKSNISEIGKSIQKYTQFNNSYLASLGSTNSVKFYNNQGDTKLTEFGRDAVGTLIYELASSQYKIFSLLSLLCIVALVEGWTNPQGPDYSELLRQLVNNLRRYSMVSTLGASNIDVGVESVNLEKFGVELAKQILVNTSDVAILAKVVRNVKRVSDLEQLRSAASVLEPSSEVTLLLGLASLRAGKESDALCLLQSVSLARPWIVSEFGPRPTTHSDWYFEIAKYARSVGAKQASFTLLNAAEELCSFSDKNHNSILEMIFDVSTEEGNVHTAYSAFTRRFKNATPVENELMSKFVYRLIDTAAKISADEAMELLRNCPFVGFTYVIDKLLAKTRTFSNSVPAFKLRYEFHKARENYPGAAQALYDYLYNEEEVSIQSRTESYERILYALSMVEHKSYRWLTRGDDGVISYEEIKKEFAYFKSLLDINT